VTVTPRHLAISLAAIVASAPAAGCGRSSDSARAGGAATPAASPKAAVGAITIGIDNFKFAPSALVVKRGAQIVVTNRDSTAHTATADDGRSFDTGDIAPGASGMVRLPNPGRYTYHCTIHPFMHGTLVVK
jgi:plastocyanin